MSSQGRSFFQSVRTKVHGEPDLGVGSGHAAKTQDELFREHQQAARMWSQGRGNGARAGNNYTRSPIPGRASLTELPSGPSQEGSLESLSEFGAAPTTSSQIGPFSPSSHRANTPAGVKHKEEINYKREPEGEGKPPLAPNLNFVSPSRRDVVPKRTPPAEEGRAKAPLTLKDRTLSAIGIAALSKMEWYIILATVITTPILLLLLEYTLPAHAQQSLIAQYRSMTRFDVAVSVTLGALISLTYDADTANTDRKLAEWYRTAQERISTALGMERDDTQPVVRWGRAAASPFTRLVLLALVLGYLLKIAAGAAVETVVSVSARYGRLALLLCALAAVLYLTYRVTAWYLRRRRARLEVVAVVAAKAKTLLAAKGRAYPISYLYEEVGDSIKLAQSGLGGISPADPVLSPAPGKHHQSLAALLFGGVSFLGGSAPAAAPASPLPVAYPEATAVGSAVDPSATHGRDILRGHSLRRLWGEVQQAVQRDSRVQRLELIVDGKRQACWRILAGNTGAGI